MTDKKADIFNTGREQFLSKGFKDTRVCDIAKMAGIGTGTFYQYYSSKKQLFMDIFRAELNRKWNTGEKIRGDMDNEMIWAIFNSIPYIDLHKREIGIRHFPQLLQYITEFIVKGLTEGE